MAKTQILIHASGTPLSGGNAASVPLSGFWGLSPFADLTMISLHVDSADEADQLSAAFAEAAAQLRAHAVRKAA